MSFKDVIPTNFPSFFLQGESAQHPVILSRPLPHTLNASGLSFGQPIDFETSFCSLVVFTLVFITRSDSS